MNFDYSIGSIHDSNKCGKYTIIEKLNYNQCNNRLYKIRFELTGYETVVYANNIRHGEVKDPYYPNICGVACLGVLNIPREAYKRDYNRWTGMINRCYNSNMANYHYTGYGESGVKVCDRWLCFQYYYEDLQTLSGYREYLANPDNYVLDKDILQQNVPVSQRVYSPQTCMFVPKRANNTESKYYGVKPLNYNSYAVQVDYYGKSCIIGIYATAELAAGAYNCFVSYCYPYMPLNNVRTLTPYEMTELDLRRKVDMVTYV